MELLRLYLIPGEIFMATQVQTMRKKRGPGASRLRASLFPEGSASLWRYLALLVIVIFAAISLQQRP